MKNLKIYKRTAALLLAGVTFVTSMVGLSACSNKEDNKIEITSTDVNDDNVNNTREGIVKLFPTMNKDIIDNASLILLLGEIAKPDENGKISSDNISKYKSKIDTDNMMNDFNSFLNVLEQEMINSNKIIYTNSLAIENDKMILAKIESIVSGIITGKEEVKKENFALIYNLFVLEDKINYGGLEFEIRDLSYASRALAATYARTAAYFARNYITDEEYAKIDDRTNDQNNKAYIKTRLEILSNDMDEVSKVDVNSLFEKEYEDTNKLLLNKVNVDEETMKDLVNYVNLEYLNSDQVANKDKNSILNEYSDEKVYNSILAIDAITEYNSNNKDNLIILSNVLVSEYANTNTGAFDKVVLDYIQFNSVMLLNTTDENSTKEEIFNNIYFQNIYKYFTKQNFEHKYTNDNVVAINYQDISEGVKFIANEIVLYTINKRPNIKEYQGYEERINSNLEESIQYIQNTITGECEKVEIEGFVKVK